MLHTASLINKRKKWKFSPYLFTFKHSVILYPAGGPNNVTSFTFSGNRERCTLEYTHIFSKHTVCYFAHFKVCTIYLLQTQICYHTTYTTLQSEIFFCILSNTHSTKTFPNKPSEVQRTILYIQCAQIL